jgi:hypothetical protein
MKNFFEAYHTPYSANVKHGPQTGAKPLRQFPWIEQHGKEKRGE